MICAGNRGQDGSGGMEAEANGRRQRGDFARRERVGACKGKRGRRMGGRRGSGRKPKEDDKAGMVGMGREGVRTKKTVMSLDSDAVRGRMRDK